MKTTLSFYRFLVLAILCIPIMASCQINDLWKRSPVIAKVGTTDITVDDLEPYFATLPSTARARLQSSSDRQKYLEAISKAKALALLAKQSGLASPEYRMRVARYQDQLLTDMLVEHFKSTEFHITGQEIHDYYQQHPQEFAKKEQVKYLQISSENEKAARKVFSELRPELKPATVQRLRSSKSFTVYEAPPVGYDQIEGSTRAQLQSLKVNTCQWEKNSAKVFRIICKESQTVLRPSLSFEQARPTIERTLLINKFNEWSDRKLSESHFQVDQQGSSLPDVVRLSNEN